MVSVSPPGSGYECNKHFERLKTRTEVEQLLHSQRRNDAKSALATVSAGSAMPMPCVCVGKKKRQNHMHRSADAVLIRASAKLPLSNFPTFPGFPRILRLGSPTITKDGEGGVETINPVVPV